MFLEKDYGDLVIFELHLEKSWCFSGGGVVVKDKIRLRIKQREEGEQVWHIGEMMCVART